MAEVDDLDLDATLDESVTVVEWGAGKVEGLSDDRLEIVLHRGSDPADETRTATLRPVGRRWSAVDSPDRSHRSAGSRWWIWLWWWGRPVVPGWVGSGPMVRPVAVWWAR